MNITLRQNIEKQIVQAAVEGLVAAGYQVAVFNGEEVAQAPTSDIQSVMQTLFACDEEWLFVYDSSEKRVGTVVLVYGNDGWDVIADNSINLEPALQQTTILSERLALQYAG